MIYCWNPNESTTKNTEVCCRRASAIIDANGLRWEGRITACDTDAGWIEQFKMQGSNYCVNSISGEAVRETIKTAAPLRVEWIE